MDEMPEPLRWLTPEEAFVLITILWGLWLLFQSTFPWWPVWR